MNLSQLNLLGRVYGLPAAERQEPARCARALVQIWRARGLSQTEAAHDAEVSVHTIRAVERLAGAQRQVVVTFGEVANA